MDTVDKNSALDIVPQQSSDKTVGGIKHSVDVPTDEFVGDFETMDLSPIKDYQFAVMVSTGAPNDIKGGLITTLRGPFSFIEMVEEVGSMWYREQHHGRAYILHKDQKRPLKMVDANTINYIEAKWQDIIAEAMLEGSLDKDFTCVASTVDLNTDLPEEKQEDKAVDG